MPATKIEIGAGDMLEDGDIVEYHFEWFANNTWVRAAQVALIENKLRARPDLELISSSYLGDDLVLKIKHIDTSEKAGLGKRISVGFMQATILAVGAGSFLFSGARSAVLVFRKAVKAVVETGKFVTQLGPVRLGLVAVAIFAGYIWLVKR